MNEYEILTSLISHLEDMEIGIAGDHELDGHLAIRNLEFDDISKEDFLNTIEDEFSVHFDELEDFSEAENRKLRLIDLARMISHRMDEGDEWYDDENELDMDADDEWE